MKRICILLVLLLSMSAQSAYTQGKDAKIDPGMIQWWQSTWMTRPIEMTRTNAGESSVTLSFYAKIGALVPVGGVVEIYFPAGFTYTANGNAVGYHQYSVTTQISEGAENIIPVEQITLPSTEGAYGPFMIMTRDTSGGQITSICQNFGSIYITHSVISSDTLQITTSTNSAYEILKNQVKISFQAAIDFDLWMNDTIVIFADSHWTKATGVSCVSQSVTSQTENYFLSALQSTTLPCVADSNLNAVLVYGLGSDLDVSLIGGDNNAIDLKILIGDYTAPSADWNISSYNWSLEVWRWGTKYVLKQYTGNGPETDPGTITIDSWKPHSTYEKANIVQGLTMYMDIEFTIAHPVNKLGKIELTFDNCDVSSSNWKFDNAVKTGQQASYAYLEYSSFIVDYRVSGSVVTLTFQEVASGSRFRYKVTTLTNFNSANTPSLMIKSYWNDNGSYIDIDHSVTDTISYQGNGYVPSEVYKLTFLKESDNGLINLTGDSQAKYAVLYTEFQSTTFTLTETVSIQITLPTNATGLDFTSIWIQDNSTNANNFKVNYELTATAGTFGLSSYTTEVTDDALRSLNKTGTTAENTIGVTGVDLDGKLGGTFGFYNDNSGSITLMHLPMVASNFETRYESYMIGTIGNTRFIGFQVLTFAENDIAATVARLCGNTIKITFTPPFAIPAATTGITYTLRFGFEDGYSDNLGSNLSTGELYPSINVGYSPTITLTDNRVILATGIESYSNTNYSTYIAIEDTPGSGNVDLTVDLFYTNENGDPQIEYNMTQTLNVTIAAQATPSNYSISATPTFNVLQSGVTFTQTSATTLGTASDYTAQLPQGFGINSATLGITTSGSVSLSPTAVGKLQSTNVFFAFPTLIANANCSGNTDCLSSISGIQASAYVGTGLSIFIGSDNANAQCQVNPAGNNFDVTADTIVISDISSSLLLGRGPDSYASTISATFATTNGIPEGGYIQFAVDTNWAMCNSVCTVSGLTPIADLALVCEMSGLNVFQIKNFQGFDTAGSITVTITKVIPPVQQSDDPIQFYVFTSAQTYADSGTSKMIDQGSFLQNANKLSITTQNDIKESVFTAVPITMPSTQNETGVDLYMTFNFPWKIPAGSSIELTSAVGGWDLPSGDLKDYLFFNGLVYTSAAMVTNKVTIVNRDELNTSTAIELYAEDAISNPVNVSQDAFLFKVTYCSLVTIIDDEITRVDDNHNTVGTDTPTYTLTEDINAVTATNYTAGDVVDYTFKFRTSTAIQESDLIYVKFPRQYDPYIGQAYIKYKWTSDSFYHLDCYSEVLGENIECTVDHRFLRVYNLDQVDPSEDITFTVKNVFNPAETVKTGDFEFYVMNSQRVPRSLNRDVSGVQIQSLAENIMIQKVNKSNANIFESANYTFTFFTISSVTLQDNHAMDIILPRQYNTNLSRTNAFITCGLSTQNLGNDSTDTSVKPVNEISTCSTDNNVLHMQMPAGSALGLSADTKITYSVTGLGNPEWGLSRGQPASNFTWNFDINDSVVFTQYDLWTNQIDVKITDSNTQALFARSYQNTNVAYVGLDQRIRRFIVGSYSPITKTGQINIRPGLQSAPITITTNGGQQDVLAANSANFTAQINLFTNDNDDLRFTSVNNNFTMYANEYQINFRIAANIDIDQGLYYINWSVKEDKYDIGQTDLTLALRNQYDPPAKTLIEVGALVKSTFTASIIDPIPIGRTSVPIKITTETPPHTNITISISLPNPSLSKFEIHPNKLTFTYDVSSRYFTIKVPEDFVLDAQTNTFSVQYDLSGTDAAAYQQIPLSTFSVTDVQPSENNISGCSIENITGTTADISATITGTGVLYWYFIPTGNKTMEQEAIKAKVGDYFNLSSEEEYSQVTNKEVEPSEDDFLVTRVEPWIAYARRMYTLHLQKAEYYGAAVYSTGGNEIIGTISGLYMQTSYSLYCYFENQAASLSSFNNNPVIASTTNMPSPAQISVSFNGDVSSNSIDSIRKLYGIVAGINPDRLIQGIRQEQLDSDQTTILSSTFTYYLPVQRDMEIPDPSTQANLDQSQLVLFREGLVNDLSITISPQVTYNLVEASSFTIPAWKVPTEQNAIDGTPIISDVDPATDSIQAEMLCNVQGEVCGVCLQNDNTTPSNEQILLGLNSKNESKPSACVNSVDLNAKVNLTIQGLSDGTTYTCYYMCYNKFPLWTAGMASSVTTTSLSSTTASIPEEDEFGLILKFLFYLLVI